MDLLDYAGRLVRRYPWLRCLPLMGLASQLDATMDMLEEDRPDLLTKRPSPTIVHTRHQHQPQPQSTKEQQP